MAQNTVTVLHPGGVHTRPASVFVREAGKFKSEIMLTCEGTSVNGKSIMGLLMLAMGPGAVVTIEATGEDEIEAVTILSEVMSGQFE